MVECLLVKEDTEQRLETNSPSYLQMAAGLILAGRLNQFHNSPQGMTQPPYHYRARETHALGFSLSRASSCTRCCAGGTLLPVPTHDMTRDTAWCLKGQGTQPQLMACGLQHL